MKSYKCPKCGFQIGFTMEGASGLDKLLGLDYKSGKPFCMRCLNKQLRKIIPVMEEL